MVDGLDAFTRFIKTEFSEENIEFWVACEDFKKCKEPQQISLKAKAIYEKFIRNDAPKEVQWWLKAHFHGVCFLQAGYHIHSTRELKILLKWNWLISDLYLLT